MTTKIEIYRSYYQQVVDLFECRPHVDVFNEYSYRVWIKSGWHIHSGAATFEPCAQGKSLEKACKALLDANNARGVQLTKGHCDDHCRSTYISSKKFQEAGKVLMETIEATATRVRDTWPAYKRNCSPCPLGDCILGFDHQSPCRDQ